MTWTGAGASRSLRSCRAADHFRRVAQPLADLYRVRVHSYTTVHETVVLSLCQIGRNVRLSKPSLTAKCAFPMASWSARTRARRQALPPHRNRRHVDHQAHDRQTGAMSGLKVLSVASEVFPLIKTGGLADVAGALPAALAREDVEIRTLVPGYPAVMAKLVGAQPAHAYGDLFGDRRGSSPARRQVWTCSRSMRPISTTGPAIRILGRTGSTGPTMRSGLRRSRGSARISALA